jgi:O-antigen/teichoic acid export membrane protein
MSRFSRFVNGLVPNYGYQVLLVLTGIWLTPFFLRHIGQRDYGLWLVGTQLLTYLTLTDFGVVALLPLEAAYATGRAGGRDATKELSSLVGQTLRVVLYQLPVVAVLALAMWFSIPETWERLRGPLAVILIGFVVAFPLRILPALLSGLQDLAFTSRVTILGWGLSTVGTVGMVILGWNLYSLAVGWIIFQLALAPIYVYRLFTRFPGTLPRDLPALNWDSTRKQLGKGFWISVAQVAQLLMSNSDVIVLARILGPAAVVPYVCTGKLASVLANQAHILMHTATPGLCELKTSESRHKLFQVMVALNHGILSFSGLVFCVVLLVNQWFVSWWVTGQFYGGFLLTVAILLNMLIRHWSIIAGYSVFCFGYQRRISLTNLTDGIITSASAVVLTMVYGPIGVPLGSLMGACLVSLPLNLSVISRDTDVTVTHLITAMVKNWSWRFAGVAAITSWIAIRWSPNSLWEAGAAAAGITAVYLMVVLPDVMRSPLGDYIRPLAISFREKYVVAQ